MTPSSPVNLEVKTDRSCNNWMCCFGFKEKKKAEDSPVSMEITERVTRTYEKHRTSHTSPTPPSSTRSVVVLTEVKEGEKK